MILDGSKDVDGLGVMNTEVDESEKWGGGRLIPSALKVPRLKDEAVDLNTTKLSNHCILVKSFIQAVDVPENTAINGARRVETHKLALLCMSDPVATPPFHEILPMSICRPWRLSPL